ncbi:MAG TPA: beta-ketoacyl synthase N-terminal-like domain-containing protein, partial [Kofleriaceae bacterium]|nr:beta-ketoacyl synthase N-terminal-like domain-containing protein [Kofleriaceae bacterium]
MKSSTRHEGPVHLRGGDSSQPLDTPVAIIGISCRFPTTSDPGSLWSLLVRGADVVGEMPIHRWAADPRLALGDPRTRRGGFLHRIDEIDADFFGISPREAAVMDPQQRLVLELGWEALEDAGI